MATQFHDVNVLIDFLNKTNLLEDDEPILAKVTEIAEALGWSEQRVEDAEDKLFLARMRGQGVI